MLAAAVAAALAFQPPDPAPPRPDVVIVLADDLGWRDLRCTGSTFHDTPHIDALARAGMTFTAAYSNGPNCAPSRASLMTGCYTPRHGVYTVGSAARGRAEDRRLIPVRNTTELAPGAVTLPALLRAAGYHTGIVGKWHLGDDPRAHGFDHAVAAGRAGHPRSYFSPYGQPDLPAERDGEYLTDRLTDEAIAFVRGCPDERPLFLLLSHYAVHTPLQPDPERLARYADRTASGGQAHAGYAAMVASVDDSIGRVLDALADAGRAERTLVVFTSDNGGLARITSMVPLRGGKGMLYEGGVRVPMIARWPGRVAAGARCDEPVMLHDLFATCVALAGAEVPAEAPVDGASLLPLLLGECAFAERALFWHFPAYLEGQGPGGDVFRTRPAAAIRRGALKLLEFFEDGRRELYDLAADPGETRDVASERGDDVERLHAELVAWRRAVGAPVPDRRNPRFRGDR